MNNMYKPFNIKPEYLPGALWYSFREINRGNKIHAAVNIRMAYAAIGETVNALEIMRAIESSSKPVQEAIVSENKIPQYVIDALRRVRDSGIFNMFDHSGIISYLDDMGLDVEAVNWLTENKTRYMDACNEMGKQLGNERREIALKSSEPVSENKGIESLVDSENVTELETAPHGKRFPMLKESEPTPPAPAVKLPKRSNDQIAALKADWIEDGVWDIEDTEGFEWAHDELLAWRKEYEAKRDAERFERLNKRATELQCSVALVCYIEVLEYRLSKLEGSAS